MLAFLQPYLGSPRSHIKYWEQLSLQGNSPAGTGQSNALSSQQLLVGSGLFFCAVILTRSIFSWQAKRQKSKNAETFQRLYCSAERNKPSLFYGRILTQVTTLIFAGLAQVVVSLFRSSTWLEILLSKHLGKKRLVKKNYQLLLKY